SGNRLLVVGCWNENAARKRGVFSCPEQGCLQPANNHGLLASSGFSLVTGIRSFFDTPSHSRIGLAKKMDDSVPTRMPISMVIAKPCTAGPPKKYSAAMVMPVNSEVMMVRDSVLLIARLRMSTGSALRAERNNSRTRSNTTTLSLIE